MATVEISPDGSAITIVVPMTVRKRGGRKLIAVPDGSDPWGDNRPRVDSTLIKAVARAHRWKCILDSGEFATVKELAVAEQINPSYLSRILKLALLAPDIVEAFLDGRQPATVLQDRLRERLPDVWEEQRQLLRRCWAAARQNRKFARAPTFRFVGHQFPMPPVPRGVSPPVEARVGGKFRDAGGDVAARVAAGSGSE